MHLISLSMFAAVCGSIAHIYETRLGSGRVTGVELSELEKPKKTNKQTFISISINSSNPLFTTTTTICQLFFFLFFVELIIPSFYSPNEYCQKVCKLLPQ
jgi:hypothetical protein